MNIHNGTIETKIQPNARNYRATYGNNVEEFYTFGAAAWWLEIQDSIRLSRIRRNAR